FIRPVTGGAVSEIELLSGTVQRLVAVIFPFAYSFHSSDFRRFIRINVENSGCPIVSTTTPFPTSSGAGDQECSRVIGWGKKSFKPQIIQDLFVLQIGFGSKMRQIVIGHRLTGKRLRFGGKWLGRPCL